MQVSINELMHYFYKANLNFAGVFLEEAVPPDRVIERRTNPECGGFIVPFAGAARLWLNGAYYALRPGMVVHGGQDMTVRIEGDPDHPTPWRFGVVHYYLPDAEQSETVNWHQHFSFAIQEHASLTDQVQQLFVLQRAPGVSARFRSKLLFTDLLGTLIESAKRELATSDIERVEQVMDYIRHHHAQPLSVSFLAAHFNIDRRKLAASFERHVGMSPSQYMIECRMLKAKELLHTCNCSIKEIAECVGYTDNLYFSKAFKKKIGLSPSAYRMQ